MHDILLHPAAWLNDMIISAAQSLLKKQNPLVGGFQPPYLGQTCAFDIQSEEFVQILHNGHGHWLTVSMLGAEDGAEVYVYDSTDFVRCHVVFATPTTNFDLLMSVVAFDIQSEEFVQILHNGHGHWLTVSMLGAEDGAEVYVYDSMYPSVGTYTKKQVASILCSKKKAIKLKIMDVQMQAGGCDCGLVLILSGATLFLPHPPQTLTSSEGVALMGVVAKGAWSTNFRECSKPVPIF